MISDILGHSLHIDRLICGYNDTTIGDTCPLISLFCIASGEKKKEPPFSVIPFSLLADDIPIRFDFIKSLRKFGIV